MTQELLPLGSILYLEGATSKLMVVGRGPVFESDNEPVYSDYVGVVYPEGINPEDAIFFNHENIDKVVFEGFKDEEEERFMEVYKEWESKLEVKKLKMYYAVNSTIFWKLKAIPIRQLLGMAFLLEKAGCGLWKNVDILTKTDILRTMRSLSRWWE